MRASEGQALHLHRLHAVHLPFMVGPADGDRPVVLGRNLALARRVDGACEVFAAVLGSLDGLDGLEGQLDQVVRYNAARAVPQHHGRHFDIGDAIAMQVSEPLVHDQHVIRRIPVQGALKDNGVGLFANRHSHGLVRLNGAAVQCAKPAARRQHSAVSAALDCALADGGVAQGVDQEPGARIAHDVAALH